MRICIVGVGQVGRYYARLWSEAGHEVVLTWFRDEGSVRSFAATLKSASLASPREAAGGAEAILFCPRFEHMESAANALGEIGNAVLIDANNPFNPERTGLAALAPGETASHIAVRLFPRARHVKAFHNLGVQMIQDHGAQSLVAFVASDDADAAAQAMQLARDAHLMPLMSGALATGALSEFPGPLFGQPFASLQAAQDALAAASAR